MKTYIAIAVMLLLAIAVIAGCTPQAPQTPSEGASLGPQESSDTMKDVDQAFIAEDDEVEIGEMV